MALGTAAQLEGRGASTPMVRTSYSPGERVLSDTKGLSKGVFKKGCAPLSMLLYRVAVSGVNSSGTKNTLYLPSPQNAGNSYSVDKAKCRWIGMVLSFVIVAVLWT